MYIVTIGLIKMAEFLVVEDILLFSNYNTKKKYKTTKKKKKSITFAYVVGYKPGHTASILDYRSYYNINITNVNNQL